MANWSEVQITFKCTPAVLIEIKEKIEGQHYYEAYMSLSNNTLSIDYLGRWSADYDTFTDLCNSYKDSGLTAELVDSEPGNNFFTKMTFSDGTMTVFNDDFISVSTIMEFGLDTFLSNYEDAFSTEEEAEEVIDVCVKAGADRAQVIKQIVSA